VTSEGAAVQSESGAASALLTPDQLDSMALRSRDLVAYLRLLPGVPYTQDIEAPGGLYGTPTMSIQGMPAGGNVLYVDGMQGMDLGTDSVFSATVPVDAVAEVNVVTSGFRAEHGSRGGAVIDVVSKAGSRDFSGSLYWYKRHEKLNANHFFRNEADLPRPIHRYATVGGTFGGPIPLPGNYNRNRDKLFFFYTHERWL